MRNLFGPALVAVIAVAGFATAPAAAQSNAPLVPNPADVVTVGVGSVTTGSPPDNQQLVGVNVGDTVVREGTTATVNVLGKSPQSGDVALGILSGNNLLQVTAGGTTLALPASLTIPGLSKLPRLGK
jgi:hypothetical protein